MNNKKRMYGLIAAAVVLALAVFYFSTHKFMTGASYGEIEAYREAHPNVTVYYTVTVDGGEKPLKIKNTAETAALTHAAQIDSLTAQAEYLQDLKEIVLQGFEPAAAEAAALVEAFPNTAVTYDSIRLLGSSYPADCAALDLSSVTATQLDEAAAALKALPALKQVELRTADGVSTLSADEVLSLHAIRPDVEYLYSFTLFDLQLTTDMERVEYFQANIGDTGLEEIRKILPLMHKLNYLKLDWCGTSDEATAAFREELAEQGIKVVWRVFFGGGNGYNALTDTLKIWANYSPNTANCEPLKYCNEVRYLDLGHTKVSTCEFIAYMPDLEVCILGDSEIKDFSAITACKKITFLEIFQNPLSDLTPLLDMPQLEYLNIGEMERRVDISYLCDPDVLPNLKEFYSLSTYIPKETLEAFQETHPDCHMATRMDLHSTHAGWRYDLKGKKVPRYALLREQIGYNTKDESKYPHGYVTEPITYESTGIRPPDWHIEKYGLQDIFPKTEDAP